MEDTSNSNSEPKNLDQQAGGEKKKLKGSETVGICFRCGSDQHSLAKCRRPVPRVGDELPFATCFVCEQKVSLGQPLEHLASEVFQPDCKLFKTRKERENWLFFSHLLSKRKSDFSHLSSLSSYLHS
jgi:hypothetical protein